MKISTVVLVILLLISCDDGKNISKKIPLDNSQNISTMPSKMGSQGQNSMESPEVAHSKIKADQQKINAGEISKLSGGNTVAEIFSNISTLKGTIVIVRGKVVKFNAQIMGKNWIHIQDGTKSGENFDLTVTSNSTAKVGNTVVISGTLAHNKDFGAGYHYFGIVENATIEIE